MQVKVTLFSKFVGGSCSVVDLPTLAVICLLLEVQVDIIRPVRFKIKQFSFSSSRISA
jgi:DNA-binding Xre family transcriptional regulator